MDVRADARQPLSGRVHRAYLHGRQDPGLQHGQGADPRRDAPVQRPGALRRRRLRAPECRGRGHRHPPPAPHRRGQGRPPQRNGRRDLRQEDRPVRWARRAHAPVRPTGELLLLGDHRPGHGPGGGRGAVAPAAGQAGCRGGLHRRGCRQPGRLPRDAEPGRAVEAAGGVRHRGQRLGNLGGQAGLHPDRAQLRARRRLRHAGGVRPRQRRRRHLRRRRRGHRPRTRRAGAHPDRDRDLAPGRPLHGRRRAVPPGRREGGAAGPRPDPGLPPAPARCRRAGRGGRRGDRRARPRPGRRGGAVRPRERLPGAGRGHGLHVRLISPTELPGVAA
ncbi:putative Uncharacterized 50.6 kDa protein in the 5'region of gyrA and gyrB [Pseudomonas sp. OF001]|nr:putative Uncharacterized 50.6 kDa protein in the 5'region of gyrA and gyrB [Pseudomonas sp. OF001]